MKKIVYSIGDEISSSNYRPCYCDRCDADSADQCICDDNDISSYSSARSTSATTELITAAAAVAEERYYQGWNLALLK
jgi:hypothetical protein